ncbi:MAG: tryptophan--tRNA ligase, partial [Muribaculaceae bacterium]|nr:tryptophan--tRNA ligase [Muribaculaceae bacterium]
SKPIQNLFLLRELASYPATLQQFKDAYADCSIRYGDLKKQLAEDLLKVTAPIRERITEIRNDEAFLGRVLREGSEKARASAAKTLAEAREIMGIRKFY